MAEAITAVTNLSDLVRRSAAQAAGRAALIEGSRTVTWGELDRSVDAVAAGLLRSGLAPGDRVGLVAHTSVAFVQAYFGTLRAGGAAVPVNTTLTTGEVSRVLADSGARIVVASEHLAEGTRAAIASLGDRLDGQPAEHPAPALVVVGGGAGAGESSLGQMLAAPAEQVPAVGGGEDLAVLLYTSGASGRPRAAMLSHRALAANLEQVMALDADLMRPDDVVLCVLPLFHVYGLNAVLGLAARVGATVVLTDRFDPDATLALVRDTGVTVVPAAPPLLVAWSRRDDLRSYLGAARLIVSGAAALPVALIEQIHDATGVPVHEGYGLTEAAPIVSTTLASPGTALHTGSVGRPLPGVEVRLVDDAGGEPEEGDPGEILVRGPNLFSGYWPDGSGGPDAEGWYRTGDVAFQDPDGNLTLVDRVKDLVIVSGFNVYPREVEDVIVEVPGVLEAAVVAVPHPYTGEAVKAIVVAAPDSGVTAETIAEHCRSRLARFKRPTTIELVNALPHTATGKVAKGVLRAGEARIAPGVI